MKSYILIFFLFLLILVGCNRISNKTIEIQHDYEFNQDMSNTNRIVIKSKMPNQTKGAEEQISFEDSFLETEDSRQVNFLDSLLTVTPKTDYCCCPNANYSIALYNNKNLIDTYYVDTLEFKTKVRIYEASYQFSFIIEKPVWKKFLSELVYKK